MMTAASETAHPVRTFLAVVPDPEALSWLKGEQTRVRKLLDRKVSGKTKEALRWIARDQIHLTLKFLGMAEPEVLEQLGAGVTQVLRHVAPFEIPLGRPAPFPDARRPVVIACKLGGGDGMGAHELQRLADWVGQAAKACGFELEERAYRPHITLARVKRGYRPKWEEPVAKQPKGAKSVAPVTMRVSEVVLFRSDTSPGGGGPVYSELGRFGLGEG